MRRLLVLCLVSCSVQAQLTPEQKRLNTASFEKVWTTIRDKHWETKPGGLDWQAIHDEFRPKIDKADSMEQARAVMREMLGRLHQTHFAIFPAAVYDDVDLDEGGEASPGIDLRVLDGIAVVTRVDPDSPADYAGVKPGWMVVSVEGKPLAPAIQMLSADPQIHELTLERAVLSRLSGRRGRETPRRIFGRRRPQSSAGARSGGTARQCFEVRESSAHACVDGIETAGS